MYMYNLYLTLTKNEKAVLYNLFFMMTCTDFIDCLIEYYIFLLQSKDPIFISPKWLGELLREQWGEAIKNYIQNIVYQSIMQTCFISITDF